MANNPKNWNDSSPAAPSGEVNIKFQGATPDANPSVFRDVSAYVPVATATTPGAVPTPPNDVTKFLSGVMTWIKVALAVLSDVLLTSPADGDVLTYEASSSKWKNKSIGSAGTLASLTDVALSSPSAGEVLKYDGTDWINASGGGGGGIAESANVISLPGFDAGHLNNYGAGGFSHVSKIPARCLLLNPLSWKFSIWNHTTAGALGAVVVYRTLRESLVITDKTTVTFSGSGTATLTIGELFTDTIVVALDAAHDCYVMLWFDSAFGTSDSKIFSPPPETNSVIGGYLGGNQTTLIVGGSIPWPPNSTVGTWESLLSSVIALS